uniref:Uncharacterized protein n=1 Tax=Tetraselmis sp. GSL018 TaxID=582737 RepID=A0A061RN72_9CHLO
MRLRMCLVLKCSVELQEISIYLPFKLVFPIQLTPCETHRQNLKYCIVSNLSAFLHFTLDSTTLKHDEEKNRS